VSGQGAFVFIAHFFVLYCTEASATSCLNAMDCGKYLVSKVQFNDNGILWYYT